MDLVKAMTPSGHEVSIEELLTHETWLRRLAKGLVGSDSDVDDLLQETWMSAMRRPPDDRGPVQPWLSRVLRNTFYMRKRSEGRRGDREERAEIPEAEPTPEEWTQRLQLHSQLAEIVAELTEPIRSTLLLHFYEGVSAAEIARRQDLPASTVRLPNP